VGDSEWTVIKGRVERQGNINMYSMWICWVSTLSDAHGDGYAVRPRYAKHETNGSRLLPLAIDPLLLSADPRTPQTCAGAKLRIFPQPLSLISFPTTPVNLLPIGSPFFPINTHALSSNRITLPSFLCNFFFVLTTTACRISPRRTLFAAETCAEEFEDNDSGPKLRWRWTTTIMRSPGKFVSFFLFLWANGLDRWVLGDWTEGG
jgi:hypothetical protein